MNMHQLLKSINEVCCFHSKQQRGKRATNSELYNWIKQGSLVLNGEICNDPKEVIDFPIFSVVLFPKSKHRTTLL